MIPFNRPGTNQPRNGGWPQMNADKTKDSDKNYVLLVSIHNSVMIELSLALSAFIRFYPRPMNFQYSPFTHQHHKKRRQEIS